MKNQNNKYYIMKKKNGITLIALVITVIVLLILAGVTIGTLFGENGIITRANESAISTELAGYKEELDLYKIEKYNEDTNFVEETLTAGKTDLNYNTKPNDETGNIKTIIKNISDEYFEKLEVIKGELLINTQDRDEIRVAQNLGIQVNPYDIRDGVLWSSDGNLLLMDENTGSLTIPDSVTAIGAGAFANLEGLRTIIIPSTVKRIEQDAFRNNSTLETVIMQEKVNADGTIEGVEYIGNCAFQECPNLTTVQMANSVTEVGSQVFINCPNLQNINISTSLEIISSYMFYQCNSLSNIEIPEGITSIENYAFNLCTNLETIKLPSTLETIEGTAFNSCTKLANIEIAEGNRNFSFENGILLGNNGTEMVIILESAIKNNTLTIPDTVISLKNEQISGFTQITTVNIPSSVTSIDAGFFRDNNITNVIIDSSNPKYEVIDNAIYTKASQGDIEIVRYFGNEDIVNVKEGTKIIKQYCFINKTTLSQINLPSSLEGIESQAFASCNNLKSIKLGTNVNSFDNMSIYNSGIEKIEIDEENPNYSIRTGAKCNGVETEALYNKDGSIFISPIKPLGTITIYEIPSKVDEVQVKEIAHYAFHDQNKMTSIKLPNTIEKIGSSFNMCNALESIEIPSSIKEINTNCFNNSTNLREVIIHKQRDEVKGSPWGCIYGDKAIIWDE